MTAAGDGHELDSMTVDKTYHEHRLEEQSRRDYLDREQLARLGKKSVLKRNFGFMSILGFSCTVLITWEGIPVTFGFGLKNGGPAGIIYGYLIVWLGVLSVFSTLSELVSIAPTSGGQYHWVSMLAPRSCSKFLSYMTGWLTVGGWQGSVASAGFLTATLIQGVAVLTFPEYNLKSWQSTLVMWAVIFFSVFINAVVSSALPKFEGFILIIHILGFFAIVIPLVTLGPHADSASVFTVFNNGGHWPTQGLSFMVGMLGNVFPFMGADAAFHLSEEIHNPSVVVPRSIMMSIMINGTLGLAMNFAILFCMGDLQKALASPTGYPFMEIFYQATGSLGGTAAMTSIIIVMGGCAVVGVLASTSRLFWSFARDRGLPFWRTLSKVDERTTVPLWSIACTTVISCLLGLIAIGSEVAFNDVISLSVSCIYASYFICASLLLYRRCTSGFRMPDPSSRPALANTTGSQLVWGPWHVPGVFGIINNAFACIYLITMLFFSLWPSATPVTPEKMNYSVLVSGTMVIFSIVYYLIWAKKEYQGPIMEVE
ncbi:Choline transport-like protein [Cladobotryum mycophilum]|uniref:Choline transport-like protein n=1 Tax=Cladobotryum mycophilum TaxID=491253 RepID=A0ABR0S8E6_9HYPO